MNPDEAGDTYDQDERQIELSLPFDRAFDECVRALQKFTFHEIEEFDPVKGTLKARVCSPGTQPMGILRLSGRESRITLVLQKLSSRKTKVTVTGQAIIPEDSESLFPRTPGNRAHEMENLMVITSFLRSRESLALQKPGLEEIVGQHGVPRERWVLVEPYEIALMSLILPGLGQTYAGRHERGLVFAVLVAAGLIFYLVPGILLWIIGMYDAYRMAQQVNDESIPFMPVNFRWLMIQFIVGSGMVFGTLFYGYAGYFPFHG